MRLVLLISQNQVEMHKELFFQVAVKVSKQIIPVLKLRQQLQQVMTFEHWVGWLGGVWFEVNCCCVRWCGLGRWCG